MGNASEINEGVYTHIRISEKSTKRGFRFHSETDKKNLVHERRLKSLSSSKECNGVKGRPQVRLGN